MLLPLLANSSIKDLKKPHFINHDIWINDPKRQKPHFYLMNKKKSGHLLLKK